MRPQLTLALLCAVSALAQGEEPASPWLKDCALANGRVLGPVHADRSLPLLAGDPQHGFRLACSVPWSALSPRNEALAVVGCSPGLLQLPVDSACGAGTGRLWVNAAWVRTNGSQRAKPVATCQRLETQALAASRDYEPCTPAKSAPQPAAPAGSAPAPVPRDMPTPPPPPAPAPHSTP